MKRTHEIRSRLQKYREAEDAILTAQSYEIDGMRLTRADLKLVQDMIARLEDELAVSERSERGMKRSRMRVVIPADGMRVCL